MDIGLLMQKAKGEVTDPRRQWGNKLHKLEEILAIGLTTLLCNGDDYQDMETFGLERQQDLKKFLELPNGIPDESTFCRVFQRINPKELAGCLYSWLTQTRELKKRNINIDGKAIRGSSHGEKSAVHVVSAWAGEEEIVLGQPAVDEKSNEITAIPKLLDLLDVKGSLITIDAAD